MVSENGVLSDTLLQEYDFYLVGAASSREYFSSNVLPSFIAAESRSHKCRNRTSEEESTIAQTPN